MTAHSSSSLSALVQLSPDLCSLVNGSSAEGLTCPVPVHALVRSRRGWVRDTTRTVTSRHHHPVLVRCQWVMVAVGLTRDHHRPPPTSPPAPPLTLMSCEPVIWPLFVVARGSLEVEHGKGGSGARQRCRLERKWRCGGRKWSW